MDQPSTSNGVEPVPVQADGEKTEVGKGQTKGIAGNPTPVYEEVEIDPNDGCDLVGEYQFGRSDLWTLPKFNNITSNSIPIGKIDCGEVLLYIEEDVLENLSTLFIHQLLPYSVNPQYIRFFMKSETAKRKQPMWRVACQNAGLIKAETRMLNLHHIAREMKKANVRTSYEIAKQKDGTHRLFLHPYVSNNKVANNLAEAGELMKQALSVSMGKHSPIYLWNQVIPMAYPKLGRCVQFHPLQKFKAVHGEDAFLMVEEYPLDGDLVDEFDEKYTRLAYGEIHYDECKNKELLALPCRAIMFVDERYKSVEPRIEFENFYRNVTRRRRKPPAYPLSTEKLTCHLRPYQIEAIQFMIQRELQPTILNLSYDIYRSVEVEGGLFYFPQLGIFTKSKEAPKPKVSGGILADEMGLGKTVELLGLIFSLRPDNFDRMMKLQPTGATPTVQTVDPVRECVEFCISQVVAQEEGIQGLHAILKTRLVRTEARSKNVYFNVNARHYLNKNIDHLPQIRCHTCGVTCLTEKMHWKPEYNEEGIPFLCPDCVYEQPALPSKATLIIVPQVLVHQWYEEIRKHIRQDVIIDVYMGVEKQGYKHPVYLSRCDIVISSYETLRHELEYIAPGSVHNLRKRKYEQQRQVTSPLIAIDWWRICLDESQLVEGPSRMAGKMLSKLSGRARWCVTGTPMTSGPNGTVLPIAIQMEPTDFSFLVNFLELYPFNIKNIWEAHVWNPWMENRYNRMYDFISSFFWRNSLNSVKNQLDLPPIKHEVVEVNFSPLEERLYQEQVAACLEKLHAIIMNHPIYDAKLIHLPDTELKLIMNVFNNLRIFIVTGGGHVRAKNINQNRVVYSPDELFKRLIGAQRAKVDEKVREYMYALCALGGLCFLYDKGRAIACYMSLHHVEETLEKVNTILTNHKIEKKVEIDRTQMVHFCKAMIDLSPYKTPWAGIPMTVPMLKERIAEAYNKYTSRDTANLKKFHDDWMKVDKEWEYFDSNFENCLVWILIHLEHMTTKQHEDLRMWTLQSELSLSTEMAPLYELRRWTLPYQLYLHIKEKMERQHGNIGGLRRRMSGLIFPMTTSNADTLIKFEDEEFLKMVHCYHNSKYIETGTEFAQNEEDALEDLINIEERRVMRSKKKFLVEEQYDNYNCALCDLERHAVTLENELSMTDGEKRIPLEQNEWYLLMKEIANKRIPGQVMSVQIKMLWKWFEQCRRTVLLAHKATVAMKEVICRYRELKQAAKRLTFGMELEVPGQLGVKMELKDTGRTNEIERLMNLWKNKTAECKQVISSIHTQISYISSLRVGGGVGETETDRKCPVCYEKMSLDWNVFPCAHYICSKCLHGHKFHSPDINNIPCVVCRSYCHPDNVLHVVNYETNYVPLECLPRRILNVKFNSILRKLISILNSSISNKILVFSSLVECLDGFCNLLTEAKIKHNRIHSMDPLKIATFRADPEIRVLCLPMSTGSAGLNLTQANHLIFLEPSIQKASVSQAIGRIARMGQSRSMTVYNFVVKGSIESTIQKITADVCGNEGWTVQQLEELLAQAAAAQFQRV